MSKEPAVYILASKRNGTLYVGVTSDLPNRTTLHKQDLIDGFTKRYGAADAGGDRAREAPEEVEPRLEDSIDRGHEP